MSKMPYIKIPKELEPFRKQITSTVKPYVKVSVRKNSKVPFRTLFIWDKLAPLFTVYGIFSGGYYMDILFYIS